MLNNQQYSSFSWILAYNNSISHKVVKEIESALLSQWKDAFRNATSNIVAIAFDGVTGWGKNYLFFY